MNKRIRNWLALAVLLAMVLSIAGCGGSSTKQGDGQPLAGKTIRFIAANHPYTEAIKSLIPEFEKQTGAKVNMESYFEDQLTQKLTVEFTSGTSTIDVFMNRPPQEGRLFTKNKWYEPLNSYVSDPKKTPEAWGWNDFPKSTINGVTFSDQISGVPLAVEWEMLFYRKDLFDQAGLKPPTTLEELEAAAKKLHNPSAEMYGIVSRGQRGTAVTQFSSYLYGFGGDWLKGGKCVLDTPEAIKAFQYYGNILANYGPPGVTNMSWPQAQALFASGKVAMWTDASTLLPGLLDPAKSKVADKVGLAVFPAGPTGAKPYQSVAWQASVAAQSKNKDAAWEFVKWLSSKDVMKKAQLAGNTTSRNSIWSDPEVIAKLYPGMADIAKKTATIAVPYDRPAMTAVVEARDAIGDVIVKAIETGGKGDIEGAAKDAVKKINDMLQRSGEDK
jgi:multiple sugar transport system substrate-binding protein